MEAESRTNNGRIDAVICDGDHVYIFEFKINQTAGIALDQIREKEYFRKYQHSGRKIILVGANFDTVSRQITEQTLIRSLGRSLIGRVKQQDK